jgi:formate hydrogenlyase subunit 6/NADH:ubiquinone oxidoreductase subunit I
MKFGAMLGDVTRSLFRRPFTQKYPFERKAAPARLRGQLLWQADKCSGCQLCVKDCPAGAIELITLDKKSKRFAMLYYLDTCTFCQQCVESCNQGSLEMSHDQWELAALTREPFTIWYGSEANVRAAVEQRAHPQPEPVTAA